MAEQNIKTELSQEAFDALAEQNKKLQEDLAERIGVNNALDEANKKLEEDLDLQKQSNDELRLENKKFREDLDLQRQTNSDLLDKVTSLSKAVVVKKEVVAEVVKKPTTPKEAVKVGDKQFRFKFAAFYFKGTRYVSEDVAISPKLLKEIIAEPGQGILYEVF